MVARVVPVCLFVCFVLLFACAGAGVCFAVGSVVLSYVIWAIGPNSFSSSRLHCMY